MRRRGGWSRGWGACDAAARVAPTRAGLRGAGLGAWWAAGWAGLEMQRSRLLVGAVGAIEEHGYAGATVAHITARAKVSRRTFYELLRTAKRASPR